MKKASDTFFFTSLLLALATILSLGNGTFDPLYIIPVILCVGFGCILDELEK